MVGVPCRSGLSPRRVINPRKGAWLGRGCTHLMWEPLLPWGVLACPGKPLRPLLSSNPSPLGASAFLSQRPQFQVCVCVWNTMNLCRESMALQSKTWAILYKHIVLPSILLSKGIVYLTANVYLAATLFYYILFWVLVIQQWTKWKKSLFSWNLLSREHCEEFGVKPCNSSPLFLSISLSTYISTSISISIPTGSCYTHNSMTFLFD